VNLQDVGFSKGTFQWSVLSSANGAEREFIFLVGVLNHCESIINIMK